jgi:hypothetical protein
MHVDAEVASQGGRTMKGWVQINGRAIDSEAALQAWIEKALAFAETLPPK